MHHADDQLNRAVLCKDSNGVKRFKGSKHVKSYTVPRLVEQVVLVQVPHTVQVQQKRVFLSHGNPGSIHQDLLAISSNTASPSWSPGHNSQMCNTAGGGEVMPTIQTTIPKKIKWTVSAVCSFNTLSK
jgi:hypothetical protein